MLYVSPIGLGSDLISLEQAGMYRQVFFRRVNASRSGTDMNLNYVRQGIIHLHITFGKEYVVSLL